MQPSQPDPGHPAGPGEAFFQTLLEGYTDVIVVLDQDGTIRYATPSAATLFGPGPIIGAQLPDLVGDEARPDVAWAVDDMLGRDPDLHGLEGIWQITGRDGQAVDVRVHSSDLRGTAAVGGLVLTLRDVTSQRQREEDLRRRASYDARTGLLKWEDLEGRAGHAVASAQHSDATTAVIFVDLDHFKDVNDTYGHQVGDELLFAAAGRLTGALRKSDTAARYGGDEFTVLLEYLSDPAAAATFADRIVQAFNDAPFALASGTITIGVTASVGVATTADSTSLPEILNHADLALYAAKEAGRGTWRAYDPATTTSMPARRKTRGPAAQVGSLDFPDPEPDVTGPRSPGRTRGPRGRAARRGNPPRPPLTP